MCVALGAFGAHGLRQWVEPPLLETWQTAVSYQFYHTLALLVLALPGLPQVRGVLMARWCFAVGMVLFSGSLYVLVLSGARWLGIITPIGGLALMLGWAWLVVAFWRQQSAR
jgi:uncharacterized membrane protein YgdD (TMEM256/DUF423 family)